MQYIGLHQQCNDQHYSKFNPNSKDVGIEDDNDDDEDDVGSQRSVEVRMIYKIGLGTEVSRSSFENAAKFRRKS